MIPNPSDIALVQWTVVAAQIATLIAVIVYVVKTWQMTSATKKAAVASADAVDEMRLVRISAHAPRISLFFDIVDTTLAYVVLENLGETTAQDVAVEFTPPLQSSLGSGSVAFFDTPKVLAAHARLAHGFDVWHQFFGRGLPTRYVATVTYVRADTGKRVTEEHVLDAGGIKNLHLFTRKSMHDLVGAADKLVSISESRTKLLGSQHEHDLADRELIATGKSLTEDVAAIRSLWQHSRVQAATPGIYPDRGALLRAMRRHTSSAMITAVLEERQVVWGLLSALHLALSDHRFMFMGDASALEDAVSAAVTALVSATRATASAT